MTFVDLILHYGILKFQRLHFLDKLLLLVALFCVVEFLPNNLDFLWSTVESFEI